MKPESPKKIVFILGGPGSGKGTQSGLLKDHFKAQHLSAGDLLRSSKKHRELIDGYIKEGYYYSYRSNCTISYHY